ncbi:hypothetical protein Poly51_33880 [Rubripirellula tenax]|uniref:Uncharacterized protein n=1 Tax=Rubripirellula tenax TaxID=2528015 RepID=A0A5C6F4D7_9BACT|nr:TMEM43 family protein [Rubripirellula tenax]TWU54669.1 hypothetical protein Poly51_33880 [Rubripirellula tenax]
MFGYFRRVKNSFAAMIFGLLMVPGGMALHAWNEYRTVHRSRGLAEASRLVETIPDTNVVDPSRDGKLVHLSGLADTNETLEDEQFHVSAPAIHLARRVEMFQWKEKKEKRSNSNSNSGQSTKYTYHRQWASEPIDSSRFHRPTDHENPNMRYRNRESTAKHVFVGAHNLNDALKSSMQDWQPFEFTGREFLATIPETDRDQYLMRNNQLFWSVHVPDFDQPRVGDIRIRFETVSPDTISLIAEQRGDTFANFRTSNGEAIQRLYMGTFTAEEVIEKLITENSVIAWVLRAVGLLLSVIGFSMILKPLSAVTSFVPLLGQFTGALLFFVAVLLGVIVSSTVIGLSWIAVRPLLGIALLGLSALAAYAVFYLRRNVHHDDVPEQVDASMFVQ